MTVLLLYILEDFDIYIIIWKKSTSFDMKSQKILYNIKVGMLDHSLCQ